jgi:hypothetical protein
MFHQSFCACDDWPNLIDLTEEERMAIVGKDNGFYQIMKIVMIADCKSYTFVMDPKNTWPKIKK